MMNFTVTTDALKYKKMGGYSANALNIHKFIAHLSIKFGFTQKELYRAYNKGKIKIHSIAIAW
jgi:hypothetical protein